MTGPESGMPADEVPSGALTPKDAQGPLTEREPGVILMALIDGLHAQHPILQQGDERPAGQQFAQWIPGEQGKQLGVSGVIDLHRLTRDLKRSMDAATEGAKAQAAAEWAALDRFAAVADARLSAEQEIDDPFPPPGTPEPAAASTELVRCQHCGVSIVRAQTGKGWRHEATTFLGCEPDHETLAEP